MTTTGYMVDEEFNSPADLRAARLAAGLSNGAAMTAAYQECCRDDASKTRRAYGWSLYLMLAELRETHQGEG